MAVQTICFLLREKALNKICSEANRQGAPLLTNPLATFWVAVEEEGRTVAPLLLASAYDGTRDGVPGLGWQSWQMSRLRGEQGFAEELEIGSRMLYCRVGYRSVMRLTATSDADGADKHLITFRNHLEAMLEITAQRGESDQ
jgi:hypothetical protein